MALRTRNLAESVPEMMMLVTTKNKPKRSIPRKFQLKTHEVHMPYFPLRTRLNYCTVAEFLALDDKTLLGYVVKYLLPMANLHFVRSSNKVDMNQSYLEPLVSYF